MLRRTPSQNTGPLKPPKPLEPLEMPKMPQVPEMLAVGGVSKRFG